LLFVQALTDTPPEVAQIQIDLLRQAGQAQRTWLTLSFGIICQQRRSAGVRLNMVN